MRTNSARLAGSCKGCDYKSTASAGWCALIRTMSEGPRRTRVPQKDTTAFGRTPFFTAAEFEAMGYRMVIWPVSALRIAAKAQDSVYAALKRDGDVKQVWVR